MRKSQFVEYNRKGAMTLREYKQKRNFSRTSEPKGTRRTRSKTLKFVVQKHAARRLHYDLRLEQDGILLSWAVPKGPSLNPSERRLAVHVEDHPLEYASFEGMIPPGEYGAGTVIVWDRGAWIPDDEFRDVEKGHLKFELNGEKLKGRWALIRMDEPHWLLIKEKDRFASTTKDITARAPKSVKSKRTLEQVATTKKRGAKKR